MVFCLLTALNANGAETESCITAVVVGILKVAIMAKVAARELCWKTLPKGVWDGRI